MPRRLDARSARRAELGYLIAAYPLTLLASAVHALREALVDLAAGRAPGRRADFEILGALVGFPEYDRLLATDETPAGASL